MVDAPQLPAIELAAHLYEQAGLVLARDLERYLRHPWAHVHKTPEMLLLARPVVLDDPLRWLEEPGEANAWHVHLLAGRGGTISKALQQMPYPLPYCCWHRQIRAGDQGPLHVYETSRILARMKGRS